MKFVKSSLLVKLLILAAMVWATFTLVSLRSQISEQNAEAARLTSSIAATEQENGRLEDAIANADTDAGVEAVAREKLGMVDKDEIVFVDVSD